jgi:ketosteroid isomerase-like protein
MSGDLEKRNLAVVEALYGATGSGDWAKAATMLTDDFVVTEAGTLPFAGTYRGAEGLKTLFATVMGDSGVTGWEVKSITAGGDCVVYVLDLIFDGPPAGRAEIAEAFWLRDGKVREIRPFYFDPRPMTAAIAGRKAAK